MVHHAKEEKNTLFPVFGNLILHHSAHSMASAVGHVIIRNLLVLCKGLSHGINNVILSFKHDVTTEYLLSTSQFQKPCCVRNKLWRKFSSPDSQL